MVTQRLMMKKMKIKKRRRRIAMKQRRKRFRYHRETLQVSSETASKICTELDRLATVVFAIENDTHVVPVGAFKMTPAHQVRRNESF